MLRVAFIVIVVIVATSVATTASAETLGVVVVTPRESPVSRAALERAMRLAVTGAGHQAIVDPVARARRRVGQGAVLADRLRPFARAEDLLREGWKSYAQVQMDVAKSRLNAARQAALEVADLAGGVALVAETSLRLGVIEFELGEALASAADFRLAHRLARDRAVTDDEFKPAVVTAFRAALAAPAATRPVSVAVSPKSAEVAVDGTVRATGSLELEVGMHLLVVSSPGMIAAGNLASVPSAGAAEIGATLAPEPASRGLFAGNVEIGTSPAAATTILESANVFAELGSVLIVSAAWRERDMILVAQKCGELPLRCSPVLEVRLPEEAALAVSSSDLIDRIDRAERTEPSVRVPSLKRVVKSKKPKSDVVIKKPDKWWQNRWLWIGVGAAALAVGTTAVILSIDGQSPLVIGADPCEFGRC